jgi:hypothetical protein
MMGSGDYISKEVLQGVAANGALGPRRVTSTVNGS